MKPASAITQRLEKLNEKYQTMGQSLDHYLDGLLYSNYLTYWDYIHTDKLLALQNPKTDFPDETIFIIYHQITELYFKLCLHEMEQIAHNGRNILPSGEDAGWNKKLEVHFFITRLQRINHYFEALIQSFNIMVDGMEKEQFLRFRMALLPASGFQSAQYRMIEILATSFVNLVDRNCRKKYTEEKEPSIEKMFDDIYWKKGATELATGKKTLTLKQFEKKYSPLLITLAREYQNKNLWAKYKSLSKADQKNSALITELKKFDLNVNVNWPLVHYKSAVRYLQQDEKQIAATGGTNWQTYLPPRLQRRIFYPELLPEKEIENWGRSTDQTYP